ncbi:hypothetical protein [Marinibacterium profundimaris]|uniref:hypothetical protein n=1 Tax=Marinibacterium profundimaris TaxID=1679460 RepID=UPI00117C03CB|nr:hypothetical protein [Marinibacterium profundimaris]
MTLKKTPGRISRSLTVLLRAERLIAARRVAVFRRQTGLMIVAGVFVAVAVVMLNVASYQALSTMMSTALAALCVALGNLVIAAIIGLIAGRMGSEKDLRSATEMRDMALDELEAELDDLVDELRGTAQEVRQFARDPLGSVLPGLLNLVLNTLLSGKGGGGAGHAGAPPSPPQPGPGPSPAAPPPHPPRMQPDPDFPEDPGAPR